MFKCCDLKRDLGFCTWSGDGQFFSFLILSFGCCDGKTRATLHLRNLCFIPSLSAHFEILDVKPKCWPKGHWWNLHNFRTLYQVLQIIPSLSLMQHVSGKKWQGENRSKQFSLLNPFQSVPHCISPGYSLSTVTLLALRQTWFHQYKISWKPGHSIYKTIYKFMDKMRPLRINFKWALPLPGPVQIRKGAKHWLWASILPGAWHCCF